MEGEESPAVLLKSVTEKYILYTGDLSVKVPAVESWVLVPWGAWVELGKEFGVFCISFGKTTLLHR